MKFLKTIWAGWVAIVFFTSLLIFFPIYFVFFLLFPGKEAIKTFWLTNFWGRLILFCSCIRIRYQPENFIIEKGSCIFVTNHRSLLDIVACNAGLPDRFQFLAKNELTKSPLFGYIIRKVSVQVNRNSNQSKKTSFDALKKVLENGESVMLYPEGTRNSSNEILKPFLNGAFKLAFETQTPIVVCTLWNTSSHYNSKFQLTPGILNFYISERLYPQNFQSIGDLKEKTIQIMLENIENCKRKNN